MEENIYWKGILTWAAFLSQLDYDVEMFRSGSFIGFIHGLKWFSYTWPFVSAITRSGFINRGRLWCWQGSGQKLLTHKTHWQDKVRDVFRAAPSRWHLQNDPFLHSPSNLICQVPASSQCGYRRSSRRYQRQAARSKRRPVGIQAAPHASCHSSPHPEGRLKARLPGTPLRDWAPEARF